MTGEGLSDKSVVRLIKQAAADAGMDPESSSGRSLRRGLLTAGGENQAQLADLMRQSRHRSAERVLGYIEPADLLRREEALRHYCLKALSPRSLDALSTYCLNPLKRCNLNALKRPGLKAWRRLIQDNFRQQGIAA
jgi:hypothetical protein